jgi:hypothetical protein
MKWMHVTAGSILSVVDVISGGDFPGAAGVLHNMEYLISSHPSRTFKYHLMIFLIHLLVPYSFSNAV